jgi:RHS repeat-associated protein
MTWTHQQASRSEACLASKVVSWPGETGPRNPQASYYCARYYDSQSGRFLSEDPIGFGGGQNFYNYVGNGPVDRTDPLGFYTVHQHIQLVKEPNAQGLDDDCGLRTGGACTKVGIFADCACKGCDKSGWKASVDVSIVGHMYVFGGPWILLHRESVDKSVVDMATAINHENNVHLNLSIAALTPSMEDLEAKSFPSEKECKAACGTVKKAISDLFVSTMNKTQKKDRPQ